MVENAEVRDWPDPDRVIAPDTSKDRPAAVVTRCSLIVRLRPAPVVVAVASCSARMVREPVVVSGEPAPICAVVETAEDSSAVEASTDCLSMLAARSTRSPVPVTSACSPSVAAAALVPTTTPRDGPRPLSAVAVAVVSVVAMTDRSLPPNCREAPSATRAVVLVTTRLSASAAPEPVVVVTSAWSIELANRWADRALRRRIPETTASVAAVNDELAAPWPGAFWAAAKRPARSPTSARSARTPTVSTPADSAETDRSVAEMVVSPSTAARVSRSTAVPERVPAAVTLVVLRAERETRPGVEITVVPDNTVVALLLRWAASAAAATIVVSLSSATSPAASMRESVSAMVAAARWDEDAEDFSEIAPPANEAPVPRIPASASSRSSIATRWMSPAPRSLRVSMDEDPRSMCLAVIVRLAPVSVNRISPTTTTSEPAAPMRAANCGAARAMVARRPLTISRIVASDVSETDSPRPVRVIDPRDCSMDTSTDGLPSGNCSRSMLILSVPAPPRTTTEVTPVARRRTVRPAHWKTNSPVVAS